MANSKDASAAPKKADSRMFLYLPDFAETLETYFKTDPRFSSKSKCARHLMELGIKADRTAREKAIAGIKV